MSVGKDVGKDAERSARRLAGSEPMRLGARAGLVANGVLHLLVAWLALRVVLGGRGRADQAGALQTVAADQNGRLLLWLVVAGFAAVVIWRLREAVWGFRYLTDSGLRTRKRLFALGQVAIYLVLTGLAVRAASGSSEGSGGQGLTAETLRVPGGRWLVVAVGVGVLVTGVVMAVRGWQKAFTEDMDLASARSVARALTVLLGRFGIIAKAVAFVIIGALVGVAALTYQPARAEGLDAALKTLAAQPFGPLLLALVALGLASYGAFCFFDARYHRV
ncbi:MAG TPA: DUF1206 domain-containing protein [Pseudonocardia sp.]|jgi:hypothetical protein